MNEFHADVHAAILPDSIDAAIVPKGGKNFYLLISKELTGDNCPASFVPKVLANAPTPRKKHIDAGHWYILTGGEWLIATSTKDPQEVIVND